jgi:xylan 1,4-beta-xylosidase
MSYWTYTDLFEEPGPPTAPFQGGFGLMNPQGIRKPAYFAYKYLHALEGSTLATSDAQAMFSRSGGNFTGVIWDFEQPDQKVSNRREASNMSTTSKPMDILRGSATRTSVISGGQRTGIRKS